jgi:hypothetical protein
MGLPANEARDSLPSFALPERLRRQNIANREYWRGRTFAE